MKHYLKYILYFLVVSKLSAQQPEFVFTKFTKQNGLASSKATRIIQDHLGLYWISSPNGLQRFDGKRMINFQHDNNDSLSLPDNDVGVMMEDHQKRLWISSGDNPCIYNPIHQNFLKVPVDLKGKEKINIAAFFEDNNGLIWLASYNTDLFVLDTVKKIFKPYSFIWPRFLALITSITQDKNTGYYWLNTTKGLALYDPKQKQYYHFGNNPFHWHCFFDPQLLNTYEPYIDNNGIVWLQVWDVARGYFHYRYDIKKDELLPTGPTNTHLWGYTTDASGTTWAYGNVLAYYDNKTKAFVDVQPKRNSLYGIDFNEIYYMKEDKENNLWLLSNLGIYFLNIHHQYFTTFNSVWSEFSKQPVDGNINSFVETRDKHIIALSWGGDGLYFFDTSFKQLPPLYGFNRSKIKDVNYALTWCGLQDSKGMIWIGCQVGHLIQLNPSTSQVNFITPPQFENRTIRSIAEDAAGDIWFGTQRNIIVKWQRSTNTFKQIGPLERKNQLGWILCILRGQNNDLWAGSLSGGLLHIDCAKDSIIEQFLPDKKNSSAIASEYVSGIIRWNKDTLALICGQTIDLFCISKRTFTHLTQKDGLPAGGIFALAKDNNSNLWFSTADGICKMHLPDKQVHNYGPADGITEQDFQPTSVLNFKNNSIAFGNTRGFVAFHPDAIKEAKTPSDVLITEFRVFNRSLSVDSLFQKNNSVQLNYSQNYITIGFSSANTIFGDHPDYYYKLEGIDKDWIKAGEAQEANYTYLPNGKYIFKVRCVSQDGIESKNISSFQIHISPPFWKTWWFILLAILTVTILTGYIYLLQYRRKKEREIIRNRIARDLHDDVGSTLSTINILSSMAKTKLNVDPVKTSEYISKISDNSYQMMEAMDDIVWAIKADNDSMQKTIARMREFATNVLEAKNIDLQFIVDDPVHHVKMNMEQRKDLFLIFKEAVNNAAKYSNCKTVSIKLSAKQNRLIMMIDDDGVGFDRITADSGNGLGNMEKRAKAMEGKIQINSKRNEGTMVILIIPVS